MITHDPFGSSMFLGYHMCRLPSLCSGKAWPQQKCYSQWCEVCLEGIMIFHACMMLSSISPSIPCFFNASFWTSILTQQMCFLCWVFFFMMYRWKVKIQRNLVYKCVSTVSWFNPLMDCYLSKKPKSLKRKIMNILPLSRLSCSIPSSSLCISREVDVCEDRWESGRITG